MKSKYILITILLVILCFSPSLVNYFSTDDWFHLRVSAINKLPEFLNFFSFTKTAQTIAFYRPLPTQVFFFIFQKLFEINPLPYHIFVLLCFGYSLYLINKLTKILLNSEKKALLATLIYGFSVSNFTRLYFLSAFQEIALVIFSLLCILNYQKQTVRHQLYAICFFVLALMSKETAVVIPLILLILDWAQRKLSLRKILPFVVILLPYLYLRLFTFGLATGDTYQLNFSLAKTANTLMWYFFWSLGAPELLIDYIGSGLRPIPRFFTDYSTWWPAILGLFLTNLGILAFLLAKQMKKIDRRLLACGVLFVVSLLPVLFFPEHKFALELGLPLVWFALGVSFLLPERGKLLYLFLFFYLALNFSMNYLTYTRHYSVGRAKVSQKVFDYFSKNYPNKPEGVYFEFKNDTGDYGVSWGSSKQISNSVGGSELFRVLYRDPNYTVFFEDYPGERPVNKKRIPLSTKMFVQ